MMGAVLPTVESVTEPRRSVRNHCQLYLVHMSQRTFPAGLIAPCLPNKNFKTALRRPHEINHDGFKTFAQGTSTKDHQKDLRRQFAPPIDEK
jgi:hypothetical protein